jgi:hypothetical protein
MLNYRLFKEINEFFTCGEPEKARYRLMEVQSRFIALRDELNMLKIRVQTFEDILYLARNLYEENGFYWLKTSGLKQGPFCPRCYESEGGLMRLEKGRHDLYCPYCRTGYEGGAHLREEVESPPARVTAHVIPFAK